MDFSKQLFNVLFAYDFNHKRVNRMLLNNSKRIILFMLISFLGFTHISPSTFWFSSLNQTWWGFVGTNNFTTENAEHHQNQVQTKNITSITCIQNNENDSFSSPVLLQKNIRLFQNSPPFSINDYSSLIGIIKLTI